MQQELTNVLKSFIYDAQNKITKQDTENIRKLVEVTNQDATNIRTLAGIAESHERRLTNLEDKSQ